MPAAPTRMRPSLATPLPLLLALALAVALRSASATAEESGAGPTLPAPVAAPAADTGPSPAPPAALPRISPPEAPPDSPAPRSADATAAAAAEAPKELSADLVYAVLVAEVAARRGDLSMAFTHYMHAARLSQDPAMADLAVRAALGSGDSSAAEQGVALWLKLDPTSIGAHQVAALLRIRANDKEGALTHLSQLVRLAGEEGSAGYNQVAGIVGRVTDPAERVALMKSLVDLDPDDPDAQQALAQVAAGASQPALAGEAAGRALELRPGWAAPQLLLVRLLLSEGKRAEARAKLESFVAANPKDKAVMLLYGQLLLEEKDVSKAREVFARLLESDPLAPDVLFAAGVLSLELEDTDAARTYLTRLYQSGERRDEASFYLGQVEERAKHPQAAIDWYSKSKGANALDAQVRIAVLRAQEGEVDAAREMVQELRDQAPDEAKVLFLVEAEILDRAGRRDDALAVYDRALKAFPDDQDLLYARAMYAVKLDRLGSAESDLRHIIVANPEHADALNALGYTLADRTERHREALGYIERAYKLKPEEPAILDSMGWVNFKLGNNEVALDYLRQALKAMNDPEIAAHLGEVLWAMGRHDEAWSVWDAALKEYPDQPYLKDTVGRHRVTQGEPVK